MPIGPARMPLMDHLGELRRRLVQIVVALLIACCILYMFTPYIIDFLVDPIEDLLDDGYDLVLTKPFEGFTLKFLVALFASVIVCSPLIFWEILAFFLPALKPNERRYVIPTFFVMVILFACGMVFAYALCMRPMFTFLIGESNTLGSVFPVATDYVQFIMIFLIAFGIAFELPVVIFYLIMFDIVSYSTMRKNWRIVYVVLFCLAAVVTPDASMVSMLILAAALIALYEVSLLAARIALNRKIKRQREQEAAEAAEEGGSSEEDDEEND